jgi:hypothetical protein
VKQVDDIEAKLDGLIEMYKVDRQAYHLSRATVVHNPSAVVSDGNGGGHNRTSVKHSTTTGASQVSHSSSSSPHAPSLTHQISRLEEANNSEPTIPVQMNDKDCDSDDELSVNSAPRRLSSRFRQPPLIRNASDLGPRVLGNHADDADRTELSRGRLRPDSFERSSVKAGE